jgi:NAD(P)-dependent dehydrogenase (short-subunit alcohol dehydrogenase family)
MRHSNTYAVITGGTQGVGLAIARRLASEGAQGIVLCGRDPAKGERAAAEVSALGPRCLFVQADMAKAEEAALPVEAAIETFGRVNALVNSAATSARGGLLDTTVEMWEAHMALNLRAPFLTMQRAVRWMKEAGESGSIVNIISMSALCGQSFLTPYSTSKGGLATLTKNVASAFARDRIRCNGILAGWMETPGEAEIQRRFHGAGEDWAEHGAKNTVMGRLIQPEELAGLAAYLLSPESGLVTGSLIEYDQNVAGAFPE